MTLEELFTAASDAERDERIKRGLPPAHVLDITEFPFKFAVPALTQFLDSVSKWTASDPDNLNAQLFSACASAVKGDYRTADASLTILRRLSKSPFALMKFCGLIDREPARLPDVIGRWPKHPAFFVSCDEQYLATYGLPLLRSMAEVAPGCPVHVHIIGGPAEITGVDLSLTITFEPPPTGFKLPDYFAAVRFVRFAEALEESQAPLIMVDADALVTADPRPLLERNMDVGLRIRPGRIEPWHQFSACLVAGSPAGLPYFRRVAEIVLRSLEVSFWGLDQYALFSAYVQTKPQISLIGPDVASVDAERPGVFWFTAGNEKKALQSANTRYAQFYRTFANAGTMLSMPMNRA